MHKSNIKDKNESLDSLFETDKQLCSIAAYHGYLAAFSEVPFNISKSQKLAIENAIDNAINLLMNSDKLAKSIKNDPFLITGDYEVRLCLHILRRFADDAKCKRSTWAENYLKKLELPAFISKRSKNRTESGVLYIWQKQPSTLIEQVNGWKNDVTNIFKECPNKLMHSNIKGFSLKPHGAPIVKECCIQHAFSSLMKRNMPEDFFNLKLTRNIDITVIILRFMSYFYKVPFSSLHKYYYSIIKSNSTKTLSR